MSTRQAASIRRIRSQRRARGLCFGCGRPSNTYRCEECNARKREAEREYMREYMRKLRSAKKHKKMLTDQNGVIT